MGVRPSKSDFGPSGSLLDFESGDFYRERFVSTVNRHESSYTHHELQCARVSLVCEQTGRLGIQERASALRRIQSVAISRTTLPENSGSSPVQRSFSVPGFLAQALSGKKMKWSRRSRRRENHLYTQSTHVNTKQGVHVNPCQTNCLKTTLPIIKQVGSLISTPSYADIEYLPMERLIKSRSCEQITNYSKDEITNISLDIRSKQRKYQNNYSAVSSQLSQRNRRASWPIFPVPLHRLGEKGNTKEKQNRKKGKDYVSNLKDFYTEIQKRIQDDPHLIQINKQRPTIFSTNALSDVLFKNPEEKEFPCRFLRAIQSTQRMRLFVQPTSLQLTKQNNKSIRPGQPADSPSNGTHKSYSEKNVSRTSNADSNSNTQASEEKAKEAVACVFTWTHGGHDVFLTGSFTNWSIDQKLPLVRSGHDFSVIVSLPRGVHRYKFIVDESWRYAPEQPAERDDIGNVNNVLDISNYEHTDFSSKCSQLGENHNAVYHQIVPTRAEYESEPPLIPPLLSKSCFLENAWDETTTTSPSLLSICNHVYLDASTTNLFGENLVLNSAFRPHVCAVASTQRLRNDTAHAATAPQAYGTYIFVTFNPLFPICADPLSKLIYTTANPLRQLFDTRSPREP